MNETMPVPHELFSHEPNAAIGFCFLAAYLVVILLITALMVVVFCKIFSKSGYHWAMGFICLVPGVGSLVAMLILAFADWPILKELRSLRQTPPAPAPPTAQPPQGDFR